MNYSKKLASFRLLTNECAYMWKLIQCTLMIKIRVIVYIPFHVGTSSSFLTQTLLWYTSFYSQTGQDQDYPSFICATHIRFLHIISNSIFFSSDLDFVSRLGNFPSVSFYINTLSFRRMKRSFTQCSFGTFIFENFIKGFVRYLIIL